MEVRMFDGSTLLLALAYAVAMIAETVVVTRSHWTHPRFALLLLGITTVHSLASSQQWQ
jgi:hypothetical protein